MGHERLPSGALHVAVRTDMHGCTGEMFEWWFRFRPDTQQHIWWHPSEHACRAWKDGCDDTQLAEVHTVEELFTGMPAAKLAIQFREPSEFFDRRAYALARASGHVSAAACGRVGFIHQPELSVDGAVVGGRLLHVGRDTRSGMVLRSHFYLGQDLPDAGLSPEEIAAIFPEDFGHALLLHCYNEFTFLSRLLPSLFSAENRATHAPVAPC
jgi:hypothetical protein